VKLQGTRKSFFSLATTTTSASKIRPRSKKMTGNGKPLARTDGCTVVVGAKGPRAAGSDGCVIAITGCVGAGLALDAGKDAACGGGDDRATGIGVGLGAAEPTAVDIGAAEASFLVRAGAPAFCLDFFLPLSPWRARSPGSLSRASGTMSAGSNLRNAFFFSGESCICG